ncbi:C13 family peptidase [Microvirga massiliensis]|uniref:C13 family peptidase n=1 Tax=Microvirga massiliensis TaxID=1033741 RepID=UPI0006992923|nr:C13 family peptidase [Microvirga massiliensis]
MSEAIRRKLALAFILLALAWPQASTMAQATRVTGPGDVQVRAAQHSNPSESAQIAPKGHVVAFGMSDVLEVFHKEATHGAAILARHYGRGGQVSVRTNKPGAPRATITSLRAALLKVAQQMDRERDVLFVFLTSHGSEDGVAVTTGGKTVALSPRHLQRLLRKTGVRNKVVIVSACYSGIFADALADRRTLVITAADATHPSFGCEPGVAWTWFGEALFVKGIPNAATLQQAFARTRAEVRRREIQLCRVEKECYEPSNPQLRGGEEVLPLLRVLR